MTALFTLIGFLVVFCLIIKFGFAILDMLLNIIFSKWVLLIILIILLIYIL